MEIQLNPLVKLICANRFFKKEKTIHDLEDRLFENIVKKEK
jgi:hypothetical protein